MFGGTVVGSGEPPRCGTSHYVHMQPPIRHYMTDYFWRAVLLVQYNLVPSPLLAFQ